LTQELVTAAPEINLWSSAEHALDYLRRAEGASGGSVCRARFFRKPCSTRSRISSPPPQASPSSGTISICYFLPRGQFDAVISRSAIHHVSHERKRSLCAEIFPCLNPGGVFSNLEHVASSTPALRANFLRAISCEEEDPSNKPLHVETQLCRLREIGFTDVDCHWKWRELSFFAGSKLA